MGRTTISIDTSQIDRLAKELKDNKKEVADATRLALNRTIDYAITQAGREVSALYVIKQGDVKESFKGGIKKPTKSNLSVSIISTGHTLSFAHFKFTPQTNILARTLGVKHSKARVRIKIRKDNGIKISARGFVAHTGAQSADKVQYNVFMRVGKSRLPIMPIRTLSIPQMITNDRVGDKISQAASQKLNERLEHEIKRKMDSLQKKVSST